MYDIVPVFIQNSTVDISLPVLLQFEAGTNGWSYTLTSSGQVVANDAALYG